MSKLELQNKIAQLKIQRMNNGPYADDYSLVMQITELENKLENMDDPGNNTLPETENDSIRQMEKQATS